ncbi:MAG: hypothetical protein QM756_41420 [Polyangiaceae bacterium]
MRDRCRRGTSLLAAFRMAFRWQCAALVAFSLLVVAGRADAYPWMIKHGYTNCSGCHADPSRAASCSPSTVTRFSWEALSTKWGGAPAEARAYEQRVARAISRAAQQKSARKKAVAAEKVDLDEEPTTPAATAKPGTAKPEKPAPSKPDPAKAGGKPDAAAKPKDDAEVTEDEPAKPKAEGEAEGEEAAEEEGEEEGGESSSGGSEPSSDDSPFAGMGALTGPLLGLLKPQDTLLIGGSIRLATIHKFDTKKTSFFPMQIDAYGQWRFAKNFRVGGSLGVAKVPAGSLLARPAQVTTNQDDGYNLISRTHWVGFDFGGGMHTLRAGRLNLPFGLRMSEHVMWVRDKTQTNRESQQQHGVSLFMGFDKVRFELMGIAGNYQANPDKFRERGYSGYVELAVAERATIGASSLYTESKADPIYNENLVTDRGAHGVFMRAAASKAVVIMAEADLLTRSRHEIGYVGFLQVDTEVLSGLHLLAAGEVLDAGYQKNGGPNHLARIAGQGTAAFGGWFGAQWFFLPHFDFRVDAIVREETQILGQLHVYL